MAVGSFAVHLAVLSKTNWYENYLLGKPMETMSAATLVVPETDAAKVAYVPPGSQEVLVTMPDGTKVRAVLQLPQTLALNYMTPPRRRGGDRQAWGPASFGVRAPSFPAG